MFFIPRGTVCQAVKEGVSWTKVREIKTKEGHVFDKEDVVIDPIGKLGCHQGSPNKTIGQKYAKSGWYGFKRDGWYLLVPADEVLYLD